MRLALVNRDFSADGFAVRAQTINLVAQSSLGQTAFDFKSMKSKLFFAAGLLPLVLATFPLTQSQAQEFVPEPGYTTLFNGHDLTGWGYRTNNFDGKTESIDGRYTVSNHVLVVQTREPRLVQQMWTTRLFPKDFTLKLDLLSQFKSCYLLSVKIANFWQEV